MSRHEQKTILLVEDEAIIAMAEARTIKQFGYEVIIANSGEKAIKLAVENKDISLILMDINLGKGINGPEAARQILSKRTAPIVFLTSHAEKEYVDRVKEITRYGYVIKNSGEIVLQSAIEMALELFEAHENIRVKMDSLRANEEKFRSLFDNAIEGIFQATPEGRLISANSALAKLFGFNFPHEYMEQFNDIGRQHYVNPEDRETYKNILERDGIVKGFETQLFHKERIPVWASISTRAIRNDEGTIIYYEGTVEDITERKQADDKIKTLLSEKELLLDALSKIKTLSSLLHIYASCKRIHNDKGYWEQVEIYIRDRLGADFSHSICPDCAEKLYPEYYKKN